MIKGKIITVPLKGFENLYTINNYGSIRSKHAKNFNKKIKPRIDRANYYSVRLSARGQVLTKFLHRLLAENFISNPLNKTLVNHKNGVKVDNRLENLEWVSHSENIQHAYDSGMINDNKGLQHYKSKCYELKINPGKPYTAKEIAKFLGVNYHTFRNQLKNPKSKYWELVIQRTSVIL